MKKVLVLGLALMMVLSLVSVASAELLGLGVVTYVDRTADAGEKDGSARVNTIACTLILDDNKVVKAVQWDTAQTGLGFSKEGKITSDLTKEIKTKKELGVDYGMIKASGIGKEWFEQIDAFEQYCIGKTVEEILATPTYKKDDGHLRVPDTADLKTSVTIDVGHYLDALEKAAANAR